MSAMTSVQTGQVALSVVVPFYDEEENIQALYDALTAAVQGLGIEYELLFVDDGSRDQTFAVAAGLAANDPRLRVVKLRKNCGQTPAMVAGMEQSRGEILVTMDGDLQNDPLDIGRLIDKLDEGYDIVVGWRHQRHDNFLVRKLPSKLANWLIGKVTGIPIKDNGCSLKAYRADVIKQVPLYSDMHRFIPAMASITGARVAQMKVRHHARRFGVSKYGLWRIYKVLVDLFAVKTVISFAERSLWWFGLLALPAMVTSIGAALFVLYQVVFTTSYSVVVAGVSLLFGAAAMFALLGGIISELVYKTGNLKISRLALLTATQQQMRGDDRHRPRS